MIECDTIIETKNAKFFEDVFPLRSRTSSSTVSSLEQLVETYSEPLSMDLRRSKRHRTKKSFGDDFHTYLIKDDPLSFQKLLVFQMQTFGSKPLGLELTLLKRIIHGL